MCHTWLKIRPAEGVNSIALRHPADVYPPNQIAFDYTLFVPNVGQFNWSVEAFDASPAGADFYGYCSGTMNPATGTAYPYCTTDEPIGPVFEPAGAFFDIAVVMFGYNPGLVYPQAATLATPEPSTGGLLVTACLLCAFVALRRRMA